jgi:hypothetical protein
MVLTEIKLRVYAATMGEGGVQMLSSEAVEYVSRRPSL